MISKQEKELALQSLELARREGAQHCRICLSKNVTDMVDTLDGEVDKITHCLDRSLSISLFVDGRFGTFSTNRLDGQELQGFIREAVAMTRLLAEDPCRKLPAPERCCHEATDGTEMQTYDESYESFDAESLRTLALAAVVDRTGYQGFKVVSEEGEASASEFDTITADSNGLMCRLRETNFDYSSQVTVETPDGRKYSGYWWESTPFLGKLDISGTGREAVRRAAAQIGSAPVAGGRYNMVVSSEMGFKLVSPVLNALGGYSLQQNNSFMAESLGKQAFSGGLTVIDDCWRKGESGSRLFDSEGVASRPDDIIRDGVVKKYFINTYIAGKMGLSPTIEEPVRARVMPYPEPGLDRDAILRKVGSGIYVTGFNGGNCNSATGDFSYGIEGFRFENGVLKEPVSGMLVTGNFLELWKKFLYAGDDARSCMSKLIPTLAFAEVDFNG